MSDHPSNSQNKRLEHVRSSPPELIYLEEPHSAHSVVQIPRNWRLLHFEPFEDDQELQKRFRVFWASGVQCLGEWKQGQQVVWTEDGGRLTFDGLIQWQSMHWKLSQRSLQQLLQVQQNQQCDKHVKQFIKAADQRTAVLLETINKKPDENYEASEMDGDTMVLSVKFYGALLSYMKNRPLSLINR